MARAITVTVNELEAYGVRITGFVPMRMHANLRKAHQVSAHNIRDYARKSLRWSRGNRLAPLLRSLDYDEWADQRGFHAEIGYNQDTSKQALLGHIIEYGSEYGDTVPNRPQRNLSRGLEQEISGYMLGLRKAVFNAIN